jgi:PST family polysaccharide transporter
LSSILTVLSLTFVIDGFGIVQRGILIKDLNFKKLAIVDTISFVFGGIAGIYLAFHGYGVWSLVYQIITIKLVALILLWCFTAWKPKFLFSFIAIKELFYFSMNITGFSIMTYVSANADYFLIGKFLGAEALGFYTLAFKLMMVPTRNISWVVSQVTFPVFSKIQNDLAKVRQNYLKVIKTLSLITFPLIFVLFFVTPEFIRVVVGSKWEPAILLLRILCICGLAKSILATWGSVALSIGRSDLQLKLGALGMFVNVVSVGIGLPYGILGVVVSYTIAHIFWMPYAMNRIGALIDLHLMDLLKLVFRGICLSGLMMSCLFLSKYFISLNDMQGLIFFSFLAIIIYAGILWKFEAPFVKNEFRGFVNAR